MPVFFVALGSNRLRPRTIAVRVTKLGCATTL